MGLMVKKKNASPVPPIEGGTYAAVCVGVIDLGEQYSEMFKNYADKILLLWELPGQTVTVDGEEKPRWLSKQFSASLNEKSNLYKFLVPWRGKGFTDAELSADGRGFNLLEMLGTGCLLQVILEKKEDGIPRNQITTVIAMPSGMPPPVTQSALLAFDMDAWDDTIFQKLPQWVQDRIKKSTQYQKLHTPTDTIDFEAAPETAAQVAPAQEKGACPI